MFYVETDEVKNILRLTFEVDVDGEDARQCLEKLKNCLPQLTAGFKILTDLRNLESMDYSAAPYIEGIMDACNQKEPSIIIRVISDPKKDIGFNIMSVFHYKHNIPIVTYHTMVEALNRLFSPAESVLK